MKTKDKILIVALELFNEKGFGQVSSKSISEKMGISYGNLCYHYPKKEDLVTTLYFNMQQEIEQQFSNLLKEIYGFDFMVRSLKVLLEVLQKYRFFLLELSTIMRQYPLIESYTLEQMQIRYNMLTALFQFLIREGYMYKEKIKGHYQKLIHSFLIIINACIVDAEIFYKGKPEQKIDYYLELLYSSVRPSLTKKGLKAFNLVYQNN